MPEKAAGGAARGLPAAPAAVDRAGLPGLADPLRRSKSLAFVQAILRVGETDVPRANGIFRVPAEDTPGYDLTQVLT